MSADLSTMLNTALTSALTPSPQLTIVPNKKSWLLNIDALVLADCGNIFDTILVAIRGALWDLRIPRTRGIEFEARDVRDNAGNQDSMKALLKQRRRVATGAEFDLEDYWDEGEHLKIRSTLPIGMTLNLVSQLFTPSLSIGCLGTHCTIFKIDTTLFLPRRIPTRRRECTGSTAYDILLPIRLITWDITRLPTLRPRRSSLCAHQTITSCELALNGLYFISTLIALFFV